LQPHSDATAVNWALLDLLDAAGLRVQSFLSRACFMPREGATAITGQSPRHLDSWLMPPDLCREVFLRGMRHADIAIVEGTFFDGVSNGGLAGGNLNALCGSLELPRLAVVDISQVSDCDFPAKPTAVDGVLLDRIPDPSSLCRWQTLFESLWGVPVYGALEELPELRAAVNHVDLASGPKREVCKALGTCLARYTDAARLLRLATRYEFPYRDLDGNSCRQEQSNLRVAVAYDDAFHCYFPDTLDLLELKGATVCDFSPLRDERLPPNTDIVYFGCGRPDMFAGPLFANTCLMAALREHLCKGLRIYAECGGLAYLSRQIELPDGQCLPMVGALPVAARMNANSPPLQPVEFDLAADCWLGGRGERLRGYLNSRWSLHPLGSDGSLSGGGLMGSSLRPSTNLVGRHQAIGSRVHLNFAAQPTVLETFFRPHAAALDLETPALARSL
jgi:cobyrinic acid a,c-diamide synthase